MEELTSSEQLDHIIESYLKEEGRLSQENLILLLREIQELFGCIPYTIQVQIAETFDIKISVVTCLIKRFPSLKSVPYAHKITLCLGPRCIAKQSSSFTDVLYQAIRKKPFFVVTKNCLKQCSSAPNLLIDQDFYPSVKTEDIKDIIRRYYE